MTFEDDANLLTELLNDTEKQLEEFNNIVPYHHNRDVFSPRLVNLLLTTCSQIEAYCDLFVNECGLAGPQGDGTKDILRQIDQNGVLANMEWTTNFKEKFQPFDGVYDWWTKYNKIKHHLPTDILSVKYYHVVTAIVALHSLQRLAYAKIQQNLNGSALLDIANWDKNSKYSWMSKYELFHTYAGPNK